MLSPASLKSLSVHISTKIALWSLLVTQLYGEYPIDLMDDISAGEQNTASIR